MKNPKQVYKKRKDLTPRIICESSWHEEVKLKHFKKCPICKSISYHLEPYKRDKK